MRYFTKVIKDFLRTKNFQKLINNLHKDPDRIVIDSRIFPYVLMKDGLKFYVTKNLLTVEQAFWDYNFFDIRKEDIVIDIGANIGGFAIPAAKHSDNVYAIEPIELEELKKNNEINEIQVNIIEGALGDGNDFVIKWLDKSRTIKTYSFTEIKTICGGCDFLKCDCEGFEWFIKPAELNGVRRIEMELHNFNPSNNNPFSLMDFIKENYQTILQKENGEIIANFSMKFNKTQITEVMILHAIRI